jgi:lysyl-tRNA synthetase class 1
MFQNPRKAKRLYFDVIPKAVDEYITFLDRYETQEDDKKLGNPVWHLHLGAPPTEDVPISFNLLLNLVSASHSEDRDTLWGFIRGHAEGATPENHPILDKLVDYAINYFHDFVKPTRKFRAPTEVERTAFEDLIARFERVADERPNDLAEALQTEVYAVGKAYEFEPLRDWFKALYEVLLGQSQGPRFGSFVALYGVQETIALMKRALAGEDLSED